MLFCLSFDEITNDYTKYVAKNLLTDKAPDGPPMQVAAMTFVNAVISGYGESSKRAKFVDALKEAGECLIYLLLTVFDFVEKRC